LANRDEEPQWNGPLSLGRVLLVDDEPELRRVFRRSLVRAGFEVVEAASGASALELVRTGMFDVVISDVRMAGGTGLELLDQLALEAPDLPVVLVSGSSGFVDAATARGYGAFDYLHKPVALADLRTRAADGVAAHRRRIGRLEEEAPRESGTRLIAAEPAASDEEWPLRAGITARQA
jgi:two-component system, NtrC family, response regulator AlgB